MATSITTTYAGEYAGKIMAIASFLPTPLKVAVLLLSQCQV